MGIEIDKWLIRTPEWFHKYLHRKGFKFPGGWLNKQWKDFLDANPNASGRDAMRFLRRLMDEAGLKDVSLKDLFIRK